MKSATTNNEETSSVNVLEIAKLCVVGLAFVLAISTLALFADAQRQNDEVNRLLGTTEICLLFVTSSSGGVRVDNLKTSCGISFASASVATACLLIVCITSFIKLIIAVKKLNCNYNYIRRIFIKEITLLILAVLAVIATTVVIGAGWGITCSTLSSARQNCNATSIGHKTSASAALAGFNILVVTAGLVLTVVERRRHASDN